MAYRSNFGFAFFAVLAIMSSIGAAAQTSPCASNGQPSTADCQATVPAVAAAPSVQIVATPEAIQTGGSASLSITASGASRVTVTDSVDGQHWVLATEGGSITVSPTATATYQVTAVGPAGTSHAITQIQVEPPGSVLAVNHVIFMLQENRSFDTYFGMLNPYRRARGWNIGDDHKTYDVDGIDDKLSSIVNYDDEDQPFYLFHTTSTCLDDMTSSWLESYGDVNRYDFTTTRKIAMDGFVHTAENFAKEHGGTGDFTDLVGRRAMAYYEDVDYTGQNPELNYYYYMASQFAIGDRWFSPVASKTIPNRLATMSAGTTEGYVFDPGSDDKAPQLTAMTIFEALSRKRVSWKIYYSLVNDDGSPSTTFTYFTYANNFIHKDQNGHWIIDSTHVAPISQYFTDVANGTLPSYAFIETKYGDGDEHPGSGQSILLGQQEVATIINALMYSPSWTDSVFFLSYDEPGGPYDHVPPVPGKTNINTDSYLAPLEGDIGSISVNADPYKPCLSPVNQYNNHCDLRPGDPGTKTNDAAHVHGFAAQLGFRVPNFIVSPFARRHYVGHIAMDHTAVLRFVENRWGVAPITMRDRVQSNLYDFFDFTGKPWATPPPMNEVPVPPQVGTTCHAANF
jgi:phospholipase C